MKVVGISALHHDASVCLVDGNRLIFASQSERFTRIKNDKFLSTDLFYELFKYGEPDCIVWYERPYMRFVRKLFVDGKFDISALLYKKYISSFIDIKKISCVAHHEAHAAACLYTSRFNAEGSLIFSIDAVGELYSIVVYLVKNNTLKCVDRVFYPNSLGLFYSAFTDIIGLKPNEEEYILMGMASYGDSSRFYKQIKEISQYNKIRHNFNRGCRGFIDIDSDIDAFDVAAAVQCVYEEWLLDYVRSKMQVYKTNNIMLGGGCALNCKANTRLLDFVNNIHIFPHPGDGGSSVGACLAYTKQNIEMKHNFWGYDAGSMLSPESVVQEILTNGYSFVINGRAEFGPRALGNRSILADPRNKIMQDKINNIKGRELFRPFAPCILKEYFNEYFDTRGLTESPYMQYTLKCKKPEEIPAVVHVDGTSRVQTVDKNNSFLYKVLKIWQKKTGVPVLLNTSLNKKGKPLINTPNNMIEFN